VSMWRGDRIEQLLLPLKLSCCGYFSSYGDVFGSSCIERKGSSEKKNKKTSTAIAKAPGIWLKALPKFGALSKKAQ